MPRSLSLKLAIVKIYFIWIPVQIMEDKAKMDSFLMVVLSYNMDTNVIADIPARIKGNIVDYYRKNYILPK